MRYLILFVLLTHSTTLQSASVACEGKNGCQLSLTISATIVPVEEMTAEIVPDGNGGHYVYAEYREYHTPEMRHERVVTHVREIDEDRVLVARADPDALRIVLEPAVRSPDSWSEVVVLAQASPFDGQERGR